MISWVAREIMVDVPLDSTTGTMVQNTPIGVKYITVLMIFRQISWMESMRFNKGCPLSPTAMMVNPMITANTST